jgi:hypothetical protein
MPIVKLLTQYSVREILLFTREENKVSTEQCCQLSESYSVYLRSQSQGLRNSYKRARFRVDYSAAYNCHGLTFASRRGAIHSSEDVRLILADDAYVRIDEKKITPGDVLLYVADGDIQHSAIVIGTNELVPQVISKWGVMGPEVVHFANDCPYDFSNHEYHRVSQ